MPQNEEVLAALTIPNVQLNAPDALARCRFIAGDWSLLTVRIISPHGGPCPPRAQELVASGAYDLVLCSEVLYFVSACSKLLDLLQRCIRPSGKMCVAAASTACRRCAHSLPPQPDSEQALLLLLRRRHAPV